MKLCLRLARVCALVKEVRLELINRRVTSCKKVVSHNGRLDAVILHDARVVSFLFQMGIQCVRVFAILTDVSFKDVCKNKTSRNEVTITKRSTKIDRVNECAYVQQT